MTLRTTNPKQYECFINNCNMGTTKKNSKDNSLQALKFKIAFFTIGILAYIGLLIMAIIQKLNILKK